MKLKFLGDRELWLVKRGHWCLPVYVTTCKDEKADTIYCMVVPCLMPTLSQHEALTKVFANYSVSDTKDKWIIPVACVAGLMEKAPGITPEFYCVWGENGEASDVTEMVDSVTVPLKDGEESKAVDDFIRYVFQGQPEWTMGQLCSMWNIFQIYGASWIYEKGKTLDMGFVKLDALPYRANWKQIFLARFPAIARWCRLDKTKRQAKFEMDEDISRFIRGSWMVEIDRKDWFVHWTIDARPTAAWNTYVNDNERKRYRQLSKYAYSAWWRSKINKLEARIYDIFSEFVLATAAPCAGVAARDNLGRRFLCPNVPVGRVLPKGEPGYRTSVVSCDPSTEAPSLGELAEVCGKVESLPTMRNVQPEDENVRNGGRVLDGTQIYGT